VTPDDVRAAVERLVDFHEHFSPLFGKEQAQLTPTTTSRV
jgi:hypothetical protein